MNSTPTFMEVLINAIPPGVLSSETVILLVIAEKQEFRVWQHLATMADSGVHICEISLPSLLLPTVGTEAVTTFLDDYLRVTVDERLAVAQEKLTAQLVLVPSQPLVGLLERQLQETAPRGGVAVVRLSLPNALAPDEDPYTLSRWIDTAMEIWEKSVAVLRRVGDLMQLPDPPRYTASEMIQLFTELIQEGHSDWHVIAGREIRVRAPNGNMEVINPGRIVNEEDLLDLLFEMTRCTSYMEDIEKLYTVTSDGRRIPNFSARLPARGVNFAYTFTNDQGQILGRLRINVHLVVPIGFERRWRGLAFSARRIPQAPPDPSSLGFHPTALRLVNDIVEQRLMRGLVLIVGPTGSGKTHTLAAIIQQINQKKPVNIITIEDPVEVLYPEGRATIQQIEVGTCVESYREAGLNAKRQDPDVIAIGEIRDADTANVAVELALTGHLVIATMHAATTTYDAIPKVLEFGISRSALAQALQAVIAQRLIFSRHLTPGVASQQRRVLVMEVGRLSNRNQLREMILQSEVLDREAFYDAIDYHRSDEFSISLEESIVRLIIQQQVDPTYGLLIAEHKVRYLNLLTNLYETTRAYLQSHGFVPGRRPPEQPPAGIEKECGVFFFIRDFVENYLAARQTS